MNNANKKNNAPNKKNNAPNKKNNARTQLSRRTHDSKRCCRDMDTRMAAIPDKQVFEEMFDEKKEKWQEN